MTPAAALALLLLLPAGTAPAERLDVRAKPVPLREDAGPEQAGKLLFLGGLQLYSPDPGFGGLSGAHVTGDGSLLTVVSDEGRWFVLRLRHDERGRLAGAEGLLGGALRGLDGTPLAEKVDQDAEDLAVLSDGAWVVSFEHRHRLLEYRGNAGPVLAERPGPVTPPQGLENAPENGGLEALAALPDGRLLALTEEHADPAGGLVGYLRDARGWSRLRYLPAGAPRPSAAAALPSGDVLVLERHYSPVTGIELRLVRIRAAAIAPGAVLAGEPVAELRRPFTVDNFEALAVRPSPRPDEEALVYMLSDDNFRSTQRTLLMLFALPRESGPPAGASGIR